MKGMYTYDDLKRNIGNLSRLGATTGSIGRSRLDNELFYAHVGPISGRQIIITGGIHARENGTCALVVRQAYKMIGTHSDIGFYFLPMLNPDGALLLQKGASVSHRAEWLTAINGGSDFSQWKANAFAVDLNVNFPAKWGSGKGNLLSPAPSGYIGEYPLSEPEIKSLCAFTLEVAPIFTVSYHALGREVYWYFGQPDNSGREVAKFVADTLDYTLVDGDLSSAGGYKDWCISRGIQAITIEIGKSELGHPAFEDELNEDIERNLELPSKLSQFFGSVGK